MYISCQNFFNKFWTPLSRREDDARHERILLILLSFLTALSIIFSLSVFSLDLILQSSRRGFSVELSSAITLFLLGILWLTKKGYWRTTSYLFLLLLVLPIFYAFARWGTLLPIPLLALSLVILMVGILIHSKAALIMAGLTGSYLGIITYLHQRGILAVDTSWLYNTSLYPNYTIEIVSILLTIVGVISLGFSEIESSLRRARRSELQLKKERDLLEEKVIERTKDLEQIQLNRLTEIEHLAEIGQISAGLFHDLINPLTALSLHINQLNTASLQSNEIQEYIERAVRATNRLTKLTHKIKDELKHQSNPQNINIFKALEQLVETVQYQANSQGITIQIQKSETCYAYCDPIRFQRALVNIVINAFEVLSSTDSLNPTVRLSFKKTPDNTLIRIDDNGPGIPADVLPHLFNQFFSTKKNNHGLGLTIAKDLLYKELKAEITAENIPGGGARFTISWKN